MNPQGQPPWPAAHLGPFAARGPNLHSSRRGSLRSKRERKRRGRTEDRVAGGSVNLLSLTVLDQSSAGRAGVAAGTTAPRSPITQQYGNKVAGLEKCYETPESSVSSRQVIAVIDTPGSLFCSFSTSSGDESSSRMRSDPSI